MTAVEALRLLTHEMGRGSPTRPANSGHLHSAGSISPDLPKHGHAAIRAVRHSAATAATSIPRPLRAGASRSGSRDYDHGSPDELVRDRQAA